MTLSDVFALFFPGMALGMLSGSLIWLIGYAINFVFHKLLRQAS